MESVIDDIAALTDTKRRMTPVLQLADDGYRLFPYIFLT